MIITAARRSRCCRHLASRSARSTLPSASHFVTTTCMPAICALAGLVPCADSGIRQTLRPRVAARRVPGADRQQPGVFALRAGVRLQADAGIAGRLAQPRLELAAQQVVAGALLRRRERMDVRELRPGDRDHLAGRVQLHRARAERDHRAVERQVLVGEAAQVAQHLGLGAMAVEGRVREEGAAAAQAGRDQRLDAFLAARPEVGGRLAEGAEHRPDRLDVGAGRGLVEADADAGRRGAAQVHAGGHAPRRARRRCARR